MVIKSPLFICIDSEDRTGKDTVKEKIHKLTNYQHVIVVRAFISGAVYSEIFNRDIKPEVYMKMLYKSFIHVNHLLVRLKCSNKKELLTRYIESGEKISIDIKLQEKTFDKYYNQLEKSESFNILQLDTSGKTSGEIAKSIVNHIEQKFGVYEKS